MFRPSLRMCLVKGKIKSKQFLKVMKKQEWFIKSLFFKIVDKQRNYIIDAIEQLILKGISPVYGKRKFQRYSSSYIDQIKGKVKFFTNKRTMTVYAVHPEKKKFQTGLGQEKKLRPINLKLSGKMLDSLNLKTKNNSAVIGFSDEKAKFHNEGANLWHGGKLPERRLLPNRTGEKFHKNVFKLIRDYAGEAIEKAFKATFR
jgi:phage gpG-like protein